MCECKLLTYTLSTFVRPRIPSPIPLLGSDVAVTIYCPRMLNYSPVGQDEAVVSDLAYSKVQLAKESTEAKLN